MAQSSSDDVFEEITGEFNDIALCSICSEIFTNPRSLQCRHTFCLHCLQKYARNRRPGDLTCPICRQQFVVPMGGLVFLEKNRDMERLAETSRRVEDRLKKGAYQCMQHTGKAVILFCSQCSTPICSSCVVGEHGGHKYQEVDDAASDLIQQTRMQLGMDVDECLKKLRQNMVKIDKICRKQQHDLEQVREQILEYYDEVQTLLDEDHDEILSELTVTDVDGLKDETNDFIEKLEQFSTLVNSKYHPLDLIPLCKQLSSLSVEKYLNSDIENVKITFERNSKLFKLRNKNINVIGSVKKLSSANEQETKNLKGCYSENMPRSVFAAAAVTDEDVESGQIQPVCPEWCSCDFCDPMVDASERRCCTSYRAVLHFCELVKVACITQLPAFQVNCLNLSVVKLAFYEKFERGQQLSKPVHEIYRELAYIRFRRWIYRVPRGHVTNGVPACVLEAIRRTFAQEESCGFVYPR